MHACTHSVFFANLGQCRPEPENLARNMQPSCRRVAGLMALVLTSHWWLTDFQKDRRQLSTALQTLSPLCPDYSSSTVVLAAPRGGPWERNASKTHCFRSPPHPSLSFLHLSFFLNYIIYSSFKPWNKQITFGHCKAVKDEERKNNSGCINGKTQ